MATPDTHAIVTVSGRQLGSYQIISFPPRMTQVASTILGLRLAGALWWFWEVRGYHTQGRRWLAGALAQPDGGSPLARVTALNRLAYLAQRQDDYVAARTYLAESLPLRQALRDKRCIAEA